MLIVPRDSLVFPRQAPRSGGVRFAPSPTGRFHIGNLRTAWISHRWARHLNLPWVVRFEDIDLPRVIPGAQDEQLNDMQALGLTPDLVIVQSELKGRHWSLFLKSVHADQVYPCDCSRKEVQLALSSLASAPHDGQAPVYSGRCRSLGGRELARTELVAWRFRMPSESGRDDFIIARTGKQATDYLLNLSQSDPSKSCEANNLTIPEDFTPAYHWACAIDDFDGGYDLLVRAADLMPAISLQRAIQTWLAKEIGMPVELPAVFHTSLVTNDEAHRLEKRTPGVTLPELLLKGLTTEQIKLLLENSLDSEVFQQIVNRSKQFGEKCDTLTLSSLGFPP